MKLISFITVKLCLGIVIVIVGYSALPAQNPAQTITTTTQTTPVLPQTKPIKPLVYQGKTFDEWRGSPRTELDPQYLAETIRALGAFGRHGYGKEAAQAIYDAVSEKTFSSFSLTFNRADKEQSVQELAVQNVAFIPTEDTMPMILKLLNSNVTNDQAFAYNVIFYMGHRRRSFPAEFLQLLFRKSLQIEHPPAAGFTWTNLLGQCDHSGEYILKYLREMIRRNDDQRFIDAFASIRAHPQSGTLDIWYWGDENGRQRWYPQIEDIGKGVPNKLSQHGEAIRHFLQEEGVKSTNEKIRKMSAYLLQQLDEYIKVKMN
jgi:hypothetical protein